MSKKKPIVWLFLFSLVVVEVAALSSEGNHRSTLLDFLGRSLNFLLLFGGLAFILAKPIKSYLQEIILSTEKIMSQTKRARAEAEKELEGIEKRLEGLAEEVEKIKKEGLAAGLAEKERILTLGRQEGERIRLSTRKEIERYVQLSKRRLREHAAELAIVVARKRIEKRLTDEFHHRLIDESIQRLGRLYENTRPG